MDMLEGKDNIEFKCIYKIKFNEKSGVEKYKTMFVLIGFL